MGAALHDLHHRSPSSPSSAPWRALVLVAHGAGSGKTSTCYLTARDSQSVNRLALAFLASGSAPWILFAPPEVGQAIGILGVLGYAIGGALPFLAYAWLGPKIRDAAPDGVTLTDWVRMRFGRPAQTWVGVRLGLLHVHVHHRRAHRHRRRVIDLLGGIDPWVSIVAAAAVTAGYTAWGGLPASLRTD